MKPVTLQDLKLSREEHGIIIGQTRTGKSFLARHALIPKTGNLAIVDPKRRFDYPDVPIFDDANKVLRKKPKRFIYRPKPSALTDYEAYNKIYRYVYESKNFFVFTDEIVAVLRGMVPPHFLLVCYQMGASEGIRMLSVTQRPSRIPAVMLSESAKLYCFTLMYPADVKKMKEMIPGYENRMPDKHTFAFYRVYEDATGRLVRLQGVQTNA